MGEILLRQYRTNRPERIGSSNHQYLRIRHGIRFIRATSLCLANESGCCYNRQSSMYRLRRFFQFRFWHSRGKYIAGQYAPFWPDYHK